MLKARDTTFAAPYALCRPACGSSESSCSSCSSTSTKKRSLIEPGEANANATSFSKPLKKRVLEQVNQAGLDEYLEKVMGERGSSIMVSPATNPNAANLEIIYTGTSYIDGTKTVTDKTIQLRMVHSIPMRWNGSSQTIPVRMSSEWVQMVSSAAQW